jgi:hypothetical protein
MNTPPTPTMDTPAQIASLLDMPDIMSLFPSERVNKDNINTALKPVTPQPHQSTLLDTSLDMQVYHIPDEATTNTIKLSNSLINQIDTSDPPNIYNAMDDYNESLCNALLKTIEKASEELKTKGITTHTAVSNPIRTATEPHTHIAEPGKDNLEEKTLPADLRTNDRSTQPDTDYQYEDISSPEATPRFDAKDTQKATNHTSHTAPTAIDTNNQHELIETTVTRIDSQPMFTHLVPANTTATITNNFSNPTPLTLLSSNALTQANSITINGIRMPSTQVKCYESGNNENPNLPRFVTQIGGTNYIPYPIANRGSPRTWYHVEEGGELITVNENADAGDNNQSLDCPTPSAR